MQSKKQNNTSSDINYGHYFELLDRTNIIILNVNDHLIEHPLTELDDDIKFKLEYALGQLWDAYQLIGKKMYEYEMENNGDK